MKVKVVGTSQVVHEGERYVAGDEFDAPDVEARQWMQSGYVEQVKAANKADSASKTAKK